MHRWHIFRWRGWQLALHKIFRSDDDRALHDHRADNLSIVLAGHYTELRFAHDAYPRAATEKAYRARRHGPGTFIFRQGHVPHRLVLELGRPVWTLWLRWPPMREWGFWCPGRGWIHWREFVAESDYSVPGSTSTVGRGCDE